MAATTYDEALRRLLAYEGGYTNHPSDPAARPISESRSRITASTLKPMHGRRRARDVGRPSEGDLPQALLGRAALRRNLQSAWITVSSTTA
jgi:hypothetical protein